VPVAVQLALESGHPSGDHVLNILARLKSLLARSVDHERTGFIMLA